MTESQTFRMPPPLPKAKVQHQVANLEMNAPAPPIMTTPPPIFSNSHGLINEPVGQTLGQLVQEAFDEGYSDIHLGVGEIPRFRSRGEILTTSYPEVDKPTFMRWLREILSDSEIQRFQEHLEFDGATQYDFARVRINVFDSLRGYAMVLRLIPLKILSMEQLRLPPVFRDICHHHKGLVLVTGPTGSLNLYQEGRITEETALEMSPTPNEMAQFLRGRV